MWLQGCGPEVLGDIDVEFEPYTQVPVALSTLLGDDRFTVVDDRVAYKKDYDSKTVTFHFHRHPFSAPNNLELSKQKLQKLPGDVYVLHKEVLLDSKCCDYILCETVQGRDRISIDIRNILMEAVQCENFRVTNMEYATETFATNFDSIYPGS